MYQVLYHTHADDPTHEWDQPFNTLREADQAAEACEQAEPAAVVRIKYVPPPA